MVSRLVWATPEGDDLVAFMARVSNPENQDNKTTSERLLRYLIEHKHWSPFEMVNACVEIKTTRDISRQILRHRSFSFQEFSGRYAEYDSLLVERECRCQDTKNRQSALPAPDDLQREWGLVVEGVATHAWEAYQEALASGVAKEVARAILPEGLVPTTMYMNGTLRSWIHYWEVRCTPETQKEHRIVAEETREVVLSAYPGISRLILN